MQISTNNEKIIICHFKATLQLPLLYWEMVASQNLRPFCCNICKLDISVFEVISKGLYIMNRSSWASDLNKATSIHLGLPFGCFGLW